MKMTRKVISVLLAVILCIGSFGAVFASAATQDEAKAEVDLYNAAERDFSDIMGRVSEEQAAQFADKVNGELVKILGNADIKSKIYTNEVATAIIRAFADVLNTSVSNTMKSAGIKENYPKAYEYLFETCEGKWENVDNAKVDWGIEPGDRAAFAKAIGYGSTNFGSVIIFAGAMGAWLGQKDVYTLALVPLIESLHVGTVDSFQTAMALGDNGIVEYIVGKICDAVDALAADPVNYVTEVLPDFARTYPVSAQVIGEFVASLGLGVKLELPTLPEIVKSIGDKYGFTLSDFDADRLALMGTAVVAESGVTGGFRAQVNGNKPVVFMALVKYIKANLEVKDNQYALGRIIIDKTGYASTETYDSMIEAAKNGDDLLFLSKLSAVTEEIGNNIGNDNNMNGALRFFAKIVAFFAKINKAITEFFLGFRK